MWGYGINVVFFCFGVVVVVVFVEYEVFCG